MKHLYLFCVLLTLSLVACQPIQPERTAAQAGNNELPPGPTKVYEMRMEAKDPAAQFEVIEVVLDFAPGAWTPPHTHGGQTFNTVLAGELTLRENDTERVLKAGEGWSDTPDQMHEAGNEGTETARLLVTFFLPAGTQLTTVQQAGSNELPPGPTKVYEMKTAAQDPATQFEVIQAVLDFAPGAWTPPHTHGGQTFNLVLEGEITLRESDTEQVLKPGEGWSDTPDQVHAAGNVGTGKARLLVTFLLPADAQLTTVQQSTPTTSVSTALQTDEEKIANAMSAAPMMIAKDAAVLDWPSEPRATPVELRAGANGWVCRPDDPVTISNDPRCFDPTWLKIFGKAFGPEREANTLPGVAYMLQGGSVADNDDPSVTTPTAGQEWQIDPPHIMIVSPIPWDTTVFSTDAHAGGPWIMFQGTPAEHLMVPIEMIEMVAADDKIANAMSAAPLAIAKDAAVLDWPSEPGTTPVELRAGTNGWVCRPDDPTTPGNDPRCFDPNWLKLFGTPFGPDRDAHTVPGIAYMLQGDSVADNDDPTATTPPPGKEWQNGPPHIMIASPQPLDPTLFSKDPHSGGPWIMFGGTPREHLMVPVTEPSE